MQEQEQEVDNSDVAPSETTSSKVCQGQAEPCYTRKEGPMAMIVDRAVRKGLKEEECSTSMTKVFKVQQCSVMWLLSQVVVDLLILQIRPLFKTLC